MSEKDRVYENTIDYEMVAKKLEKQLERCTDESERRHQVIVRMEKRIDELEKTLHHQSVLLHAYKDVVFHYQGKVMEYEKKYGEL